MVKIFSATQPSVIRKHLNTPKHLVLFGRPHDVRKHQPRFRVKVYDTTSNDIIESIGQEQPYRHYLGVYTKAITTDELREDIEATILEKYGVGA